MIGGRSVLALIPARGGSKGLPRKNVLELCGKPLIAWSIEQAIACPEIDRVVVSTDDQEIADISRQFGAEVPFMRPSALAADTASSVSVIFHALDHLESLGLAFDILVLLEPTSPLREVGDISGAIRHLLSEPRFESVVGVSQVESVHPAFLYRLEEGTLRPYLNEQKNNVRRQDIDKLYFLEGSVYCSYVASLRSRMGFYHEATAPWVVPRYKAIEIDELPDLIAVEALISARSEGKIQ